MFARVFAVFVALFTTGYSGNATAQEFTYAAYVFNPVMQPKGLDDVVVDCARNNWCEALVAAGAAYLGIPPEQVKLASEIIKSRRERAGEETRNWVKPSAGRKFCRAYLRFKSVAPRGGSKMPKMSIGVWSKEIGIYAHTPKQRYTGGRTWIDSVLVVEMVKAGNWPALKKSGRCTTPGSEASRKKYFCGGRGCRTVAF